MASVLVAQAQINLVNQRDAAPTVNELMNALQLFGAIDVPVGFEGDASNTPRVLSFHAASTFSRVS